MRFVFTVLIVVCFVIGLKAQEFNGGLYGSAVISQLDGDWYGGYNKLGFASGAYVNRFLKKDLLALQIGLRYIQKGSRAVNNEYKCKTHYVEMPFTFLFRINDKFNINVSGKRMQLKKFYLEAGLTLGYNIYHTEYFNGVKDPNTAEFNKTEFGLIGGINYELSDKLTVGGHFLYSILNVRPHTQSGYIKGGQYNNLLTLTLAYELGNWK